MEEHKLNTENDYLAKWLEGVITDSELKEKVSEVDYVAFMKLRKGLDVLDKLDTPLNISFNQIKGKIEQNKNSQKASNKNWYIAIAASIILFFGLFTIFDNDNVSIQSSFGEQKTIALLDGSEVILNSMSQINYNENDWDNNRMLSLEGEAYFKVRKGSTFTVNTDNGSVTVLGTQFNVNSNDDYFEVVCYEGKVKVTQNNTESILVPHNNVRRINGHAIEKWQSEVSEPSWINGESTFRSVPVKYVITALESQYDVKFNKGNIDDSVIFTGSFTHNNLEIALKTVFKPLQIKYIEREKNSIELNLN